jgi:N-acetylmuramoyl-L-alanine amidase
MKLTIKIIQPVVFAAIFAATLFTAWTEPGLLPISLTRNYSLQKMPVASNANLTIPTSSSRTRPLIGIVPGHSGHDSGAVCQDGLTEVSINQQIASYLQKILLDNKLDVELLDEFDDRLPGYQAVVLISIHADSCDFINTEATGFKVASALSNPHPERTARLTTCLRSRYAQTTGLSLHNSITVDMTSYHAFDEIANDTAAAIIEVGFMNLDKQLLTQKTELVAQGIAAGLLCFINNEDVSN